MGIFAAGLWSKNSSGVVLSPDIIQTMLDAGKYPMAQNGIGGTTGVFDIHQNIQPAGGGDANASGGNGGGSAPAGGGGSLGGGGGGGGNDSAQMNNQAARIQAASAQANVPSR